MEGGDKASRDYSK